MKNTIIAVMLQINVLITKDVFPNFIKLIEDVFLFRSTGGFLFFENFRGSPSLDSILFTYLASLFNAYLCAVTP